MNTKFLLSPAYLVSVIALVVGAILASTQYMVIGWMIFIVGIALNAMGLVVLANREYLRQNQRAGSLPKAHTRAETPAPTQQQPVKKRPGKITESHEIFPYKR